MVLIQKSVKFDILLGLLFKSRLKQKLEFQKFKIFCLMLKKKGKKPYLIVKSKHLEVTE